MLVLSFLHFLFICYHYAFCSISICTFVSFTMHIFFWVSVLVYISIFFLGAHVSLALRHSIFADPFISNIKEVDPASVDIPSL